MELVILNYHRNLCYEIRKEKITLLYNEKPRCVIIPFGYSKKENIKAHPFPGMLSNEKKQAKEIRKENLYF